MSKVVDITEKLNFDENPKLVVKEKEMEVNADAATVLKIMGILGNGEDVSPKEILSVYELIFNEKVRKEIDKLKLSFPDFRTLIMVAINLVTEGDEQGEQ